MDTPRPPPVRIGHAASLPPYESDTPRPQALAPAACLLAPGQQLVLAGDPRQLGPVVRAPLALRHGLAMSLLERLMTTRALYAAGPSGSPPPPPPPHCPVPFCKTCFSSLDFGQAMDLARTPARMLTAARSSFDARVLTQLVDNYRSHPLILQAPRPPLLCQGKQGVGCFARVAGGAHTRAAPGRSRTSASTAVCCARARAPRSSPRWRRGSISRTPRRESRSSSTPCRCARPPPRPPPSRTKWTRRVPHPVLIGHAACQALTIETGCFDARGAEVRTALPRTNRTRISLPPRTNRTRLSLSSVQTGERLHISQS